MLKALLMAKKRTHVLIARGHFQTEQKEMNTVTKYMPNVITVTQLFLVTMLEENILVPYTFTHKKLTHVMIARRHMQAKKEEGNTVTKHM